MANEARRSVPGGVRLPGDTVWIYLFLLPVGLLYGGLVLWPVVAGAYNSLTDWRGFGGNRAFVGLANYEELVADGLFWNALENSFLFMAINVPIRLALALALALLVNNAGLRFRTAFRTAIFLPVVSATAIVGVVMTFIFSPFNGPVNLLLLRLGLVAAPVDFLGDATTALPTVAAVSIWKWTGISMIYWLASLQAIPTELYEAARVDGASGLQVFRTITLPLLVPFAVVITLVSMVNMLQVFDLVQTMTGGGPFYNTEVMEIYIFRHAFSAEMGVPRLGFASAAAIFFGLTTAVLALVYGVGWRFAARRRAEMGRP